MVETLEAIFDGKVLRPNRPLTLEPNTRVRITDRNGAASRRESDIFSPHGAFA